MLVKVKSIRTKLQLTFLIFLFLSILITAFSFYFIRKITTYQETQRKLDQLTILVLEAKKHQKDFLLMEVFNADFMVTGKSKVVMKHDSILNEIEILLHEIKFNPVIGDLKFQNDLLIIETAKNQYRTSFDSLTRKIRERGFKDWGLEGKMRVVVHKLENEYSSIIPKADILMLRRHEKDFFLRKDEKYIEKLHFTVDKILKNTNNQKETKSILESYANHFDRIVNVEKQIGLDNSMGLKASIKKSFDIIEPKTELIHTSVSAYAEKMIKDSEIIISSLVLIVLLLTAVLGIYFSYAISKPIILLDRISRSITKRLKNQEKFLSSIQSRDELGNFSKNFQLMLIKLKNNLKAVEEQNKKLLASAEEEKIRSWNNEGNTMMADVLRNYSLNTEELYNRIIAGIVKYLRVNQGALFILEGERENKYLELKATYAYDKRKFSKKIIAPGEGLLGQAFMEKKYTYLTDVPQFYTTITSGLGEATAGHVLIMPLKVNEKVLGLIELASFSQIEQYKINFLEKLGENIATSLYNIEAQFQTEFLLAESQRMTNELQVREEEMKQNLEELLASQEKSQHFQNILKQKESQLLEEMANLNKENSLLEETIEELKLKLRKMEDTLGKYAKVEENF
ncbi:MAG TPA: GAF domain-containing protein [Cytophagales bacterium]|nr:GAF domain-containing protein [Cytophagales bacterium]